jgi:DNA-binding NarL/FixJ family response regulator
MTSPIRVAVISPQAIVRAGITCLLAKHAHRVEIVRIPGLPDEPDPDVVIYDVLALLDDSRQLHRLIELTSSRVLAVDRELRPDLVGQALATGVDGFFSIGVKETELLAAVESAATGWQAGDPGTDPIVGSTTSEARAHQLGADVGLTHREVEVLELVARGFSNEQIACALFLSVNSIKTYIRTGYRKIGVTDRSGAVAWAIRHGFASERV